MDISMKMQIHCYWCEERADAVLVYSVVPSHKDYSYYLEPTRIEDEPEGWRFYEHRGYGDDGSIEACCPACYEKRKGGHQPTPLSGIRLGLPPVRIG